MKRYMAVWLEQDWTDDKEPVYSQKECATLSQAKRTASLNDKFGWVQVEEQEKHGIIWETTREWLRDRGKWREVRPE